MEQRAARKWAARRGRTPGRACTLNLARPEANASAVTKEGGEQTQAQARAGGWSRLPRLAPGCRHERPVQSGGPDGSKAATEGGRARLEDRGESGSGAKTERGRGRGEERDERGKRELKHEKAASISSTESSLT